MKTTLFFGTDREFEGNKFESDNHEGVHFETNLETLSRVATGLRPKKHFYSINVNEKLLPFYIDADLLLWSGPNIAQLLLNKMNSENYPDPWWRDDEPDQDITPDMVRYNIPDNYKEELLDIIDMGDTDESFTRVFKILYKLGYNCIDYLIYEGNKTTDRAIILDTNAPFDFSTLHEI